MRGQAVVVQAPFVAVEENGDLYIFRSPKDVGIDLEAIDVRAGCGAGLSSGRRDSAVGTFFVPNGEGVLPVAGRVQDPYV